MAKELPSVYAPGGLNLKVPLTMRNVGDCVDGRNFDLLDTGHLVKRKGFVQKAGGSINVFNAYGLTTYDQYISEITLDPAAGFGAGPFGLTPFGDPPVLGTTEIKNRMISLGPTPYMWKTLAMRVGCTAGNEDLVNIFTDTDGDVKFQIIDADTEAVNFTYTLGTGNEISPVLLSTLVSAIDAEANYTASRLDTDEDLPAAFLNRSKETILTTTGTDFIGGKWTGMNPSLTPLWPEMSTHLLDRDFANATAVGVNGVVYMSNGWDPMLKYDGRACYYAGAPEAGTVSASVTATAGNPNGIYLYEFQYVSVDARRQEIIGGLSDPSVSVNTAGSFKIDVTLPSLSDTSGYDCRGCIFDTNHSAVDQGSNVWRLRAKASPTPTCEVGDILIFYDTVSATFLEKLVVAMTDQTTYWDIDISSDALVTVVNDSPASANLRMRLYRTVASGSAYKYLTDVANDMRGNNVVYSDNSTDASLGVTYPDPEKYPMPPPKCKYSVVWQNNIILAGDPNAPYNVYYSEYDGTTLVPENFPAENVITTSAQRTKSEITGIAVIEDTLLIFTRQSITAVTGSLASDTYTLSGISTDIGCVAHGSIVNTNKSVIFLSEKGVYRISAGSLRGFDIAPLSQNLDPYFKKGYSEYVAQTPASVSAVYWANRNVYILFLSELVEDGTVSYTSAPLVTTLVLKLDTNQWIPWEDLNGIGGATIFSDLGDGDNEGITSPEALWIQSREVGATAGMVKGKLYRESDTNSELDFCDHSTAIDMEYTPSWEFASAPTGLKLYTQLAIDAFRTSANIPYTPTGTISIDLYRDFSRSSSEVTLTADYASNDQRIPLSLPLAHRRAIGITYKNSEFNKNILISGWAWERLRYTPEIRR